MSVSTADRFINSAERFGDKIVTVTNLNPSVLYALAAPSTPDDVVEELRIDPKFRNFPATVSFKPHNRPHVPAERRSAFPAV